MKLLRCTEFTKRFVWVVYNILWKNPNKLYNQHNSKFFRIITVQSNSVISNSLQSHGLQCHRTISSSVIPFSSCFQSFPASESFQMSQFFISGGQSIGVSASTSVLSISQFKSINSSALSFLYSLTLTSIHDYRKNHSLD